MNTTISLRPATISSSVNRDLRAVLRSEWVKARSVRMTPTLLGLAGVIGIGMSVILGRLVTTDPYDHLPFTIGNTFLVSSWLTTILAMIAGVLLFTSEVQHGTLAGALTARPSKSTLVAGKAMVAATFGLAMGSLGIIGGLVGGLGLEPGDLSGAVSGVAWALVLTTLAPVLGLGVGLILRHSAAAVTSVLVWAFVIENLARGLLSPHISRLMPFTAANGLLGIRSASDTSETLAVSLSHVGNLAVLGCWAAAALAIGTVLFTRQDS